LLTTCFIIVGILNSTYPFTHLWLFFEWDEWSKLEKINNDKYFDQERVLFVSTSPSTHRFLLRRKSAEEWVLVNNDVYSSFFLCPDKLVHIVFNKQNNVRSYNTRKNKITPFASWQHVVTRSSRIGGLPFSEQNERRVEDILGGHSLLDIAINVVVCSLAGGFFPSKAGRFLRARARSSWKNWDGVCVKDSYKSVVSKILFEVISVN
jgi:hypothetical protein